MRVGLAALGVVLSVSLPALAQRAPAPPPAPAAPPAASPPLPAPPAPEMGEQMVWLPGGGVVRGQLIELLPNVSVTVKLATGEIRRYAWNQIVATAPAGAAGAPGAPPPVPTVVVRIDGDNPRVVLEREVGSVGVWTESGDPSGTASVWRRVCAAPCGIAVSVGDTYRIGGDRVRPSDAFSLQGRGEAVALHVSPGSQGAYRTGKDLVSTGIGLGVLGAILVLIPNKADPGDETAQDAFQKIHTAGYIGIGLGAVLTLVGIPLWAGSGTSVRTDSGDKLSRGSGPAIGALRFGPGGIVF